MNCAISGEVPEDPVVSVKSGHVFERRLIEKHLSLTSVCPVTNQELHKEDLIAVKFNTVVRPRPPAAASVPGALKIMQSEWDALMLETYNLKQTLQTTREELARVMYQHDAACRVIARLIKERDQARAAVTDVQSNMAAAAQQGSTQGAAAMEVEAGGLNKTVVGVIMETAKPLSANRKKLVKTATAEVASPEALQSYHCVGSHPVHSASKPGILCVDIHAKHDSLVVTGGVDATAVVFNRATNKVDATLKHHKKAVTAVKFHPTEETVITTSQDHTACIWQKAEGKYSVAHTLSQHTKEVVGCTVHPSGNYVVTASADASWNFYDVKSGELYTSVTDASTNGFTCVEFHPDGVIMGAGTNSNLVQIYDMKQQKNVCAFSNGHSAPISALSFSENGYYLASSDVSGTVKLWDLRKLADFHTIAAEDSAGVFSLAFDLSGSYLAIGGSDVRVFRTKPWDIVKMFSDHSAAVTGLRFGANAKYIASVSKDRSLKFFAAK